MFNDFIYKNDCKPQVAFRHVRKFFFLYLHRSMVSMFLAVISKLPLPTKQPRTNERWSSMEQNHYTITNERNGRKENAKTVIDKILII